MAVQVDAAILPQLPLKFFDRDADTVARALLGTFVFTFDRDGNHTGGKIVETEAYDQSDLAAHCFSGHGRDASASSKPMFFEGGHAYLYYASLLLCLNFVCDRAGFGSAVLIRALEALRLGRPWNQFAAYLVWHSWSCLGRGVVMVRVVVERSVFLPKPYTVFLGRRSPNENGTRPASALLCQLPRSRAYLRKRQRALWSMQPKPSAP